MIRRLSRGTALPLIFALAACTEGAFDRDPEVSKIGIDPQDMLAAQTVSVPMPQPKPERQPYRAEAASLWEQGSTGFFGDQRATQVGDILTVKIEIDDEAQLSNASDRTRSGGGSLAFPKFFGYGSQIDKVLPGVGPEDLPTGNIVDISSISGASGSGSITRNESISLRVAALVVQTLPNGNLVVLGRQEVKVNEELRELRVAGIIRPQDIDMDNTIAYDKIAEARISYGGRGSVSYQQSRRYGEDFMDIILPY
ncbi:MAG: flagellar basal body L-ring protein FlgH [Pseudooceanicola sp.]